MNDDYNNLIDNEPNEPYEPYEPDQPIMDQQEDIFDEPVVDTFFQSEVVTLPPKKRPYQKWYIHVAVYAIILTFVSGFTFGAGYLTATYYGQSLSGLGTDTSTVTTADALQDVNVTQVQSIVSNSPHTSSIATIAKEVSPAIVTIATYTGEKPTSPFDYFNYSGGTGSGIVFDVQDDRLLIATNYHVIEGAGNIEVIFNDGSIIQAEVLGYDSKKDVAVLAIPLKDANQHMDQIVLATFGDSDQVSIGELAIAIGNPLGPEYALTVTSGIISALGRDIFIDQNTAQVNLIQTDAAINPGNSGGALLNDQGQVIGINSAKYVAESVEGIGFAIPINDAIQSIEAILASPEVVDVGNEMSADRAFLGVQISDITSDIYNKTGMTFGVYITGIFAGSGAEEAGILVADILYNINGERVQNVQELFNILDDAQVGDSLEIGLVRGDEILTVTAPLYSYEAVMSNN